MGYATITNLEQGLTSQHRFFELIKSDVDTVDRLSELYSRASKLNLEKDGHLVEASLESILRRQGYLDRFNVSIESSKPELLTRLKDTIIKIFRYIADKIKAFLDWSVNFINKLDVRRKALNKKLNELLKVASSHKNGYGPIVIRANDMKHLVVKDGLPENMSEAVIHLKKICTGYVDSDYLKSFRAIHKTVKTKRFDVNDDGFYELLNQHLTVLEDAQSALISTIVPVRKLADGKITEVTSVIGNKTIVFLNQLAADRNHKVFKQGLNIIDTPGTKNSLPEKTYTNLMDRQVVISLIKNNIDLVSEANQLADLNKELNRIFKDLRMAIIKLDFNNAFNKGKVDTTLTTNRVQEIADNLTILVQAGSVFPTSLYAHVMRVASVQTNLLSAIVKTGD